MSLATIYAMRQAPQPIPLPGSAVRITAAPLPALGTKAPYSSNGGSKHTGQGSDGVRIYVSGGDWTSSATDGTWAADMQGAGWSKIHPGPTWPDVPAPHALQDGLGFAWVARVRKFLLWPGSYYPYPAPIDIKLHPVQSWSRGMWWLDPATMVYEQDLRLFSTPYSSTGNLYGGAWDEVNNHIVAFSDSGGGFYAQRWDVIAGVKLPNSAFTVQKDQKLPAAYFRRGQYAKIGRDVFILGYRTDGTSSGRASMMLRWNLDSLVMTEVAAPPYLDMRQWDDKEVRTGVSNGRLIWPRCMGPEGEIDGIGIYDPQTDVWTVDNTRPGYGNFIGNSLCTLPDGRVGMCGGSFGKQQTHYWFIEAV